MAAFWSWWAQEGRAQATAAFDGDGDVRALGEQLAARVHAIDPGLAFETGAGRTARHVLVVTAAGDRELRGAADRWLAAAPAPDATFEYDAWRRPVPDPDALAIDLGDGAVDVASMLAVTRSGDALTHVEAWHPAFADLPDDVRGQITFLVLDAVLGERVVEERVGAVSWTDREPADGVPFSRLRALLGQ